MSERTLRGACGHRAYAIEKLTDFSIPYGDA
jgi:hypothetical protein